MRGITRDCIWEMIDRKIIYLFGIITLLVMVGIMFTSNLEISSGFGGENMKLEDLNQALGNPLMVFFSWFLSVLVFLGVFATAGLLPNMLIKGRSDYYLSKPLSRPSLLLNKLLGVWISYGGLIIICGLLTYFAITIVHGGFTFEIIYLFIFALLSFLSWLMILFFVGVMSGSQPISIMTAFIVWVLHKVISSAYLVREMIESEIVKTSIRVLNFLIPKNGVFFDIGEQLVKGENVTSWFPIYTTFITSIVLLAVSVYLFQRKDY